MPGNMFPRMVYLAGETATLGKWLNRGLNP